MAEAKSTFRPAAISWTECALWNEQLQCARFQSFGTAGGSK